MSSYPIVLTEEFCNILFPLHRSQPHSIRHQPSAYEGWRGLVYQRTDPKSRCSQDALAEYTDYAVDGEELFSTVGIDHSFYRPASAKQLAHYARKVPVGSGGCVQQRRSYGYWDKEYLRLKIPTAFLP